MKYAIKQDIESNVAVFHCVFTHWFYGIDVCSLSKIHIILANQIKKHAFEIVFQMQYNGIILTSWLAAHQQNEKYFKQITRKRAY